MTRGGESPSGAHVLWGSDSRGSDSHTSEGRSAEGRPIELCMAVEMFCVCPPTRVSLATFSHDSY